MLRMMRAFRVFRLFKRVKSLNKIIVSLAKAVPGVVNAFFIMLLVMCIYAILAVDLFRGVGEGGHISFEFEEFDDYFTARGGWFGREYFGTFLKSLYTLFQVLTGESWSEAVARPLIEGWSPLGAGIFFVTFILLNAIVLINVVVAVLLEKMVDDEDDGGNDEASSDYNEDSDGALVLAKAANTNLVTQMTQMKQDMEQLHAAIALLMERLEHSKPGATGPLHLAPLTGAPLTDAPPTDEPNAE